MGQAWKEALLRAAGKMTRKRIKGGKARVVLNGANTIMGRAKRGIYEGRHIQFGNQISVDGGNKSRRSWKPNVHRKRLYSFALDQYIRIHVTSHALRSIDKAGGIDEYLLHLSDDRMENDLCLYWKRQIQTVNRYLYRLQSGNIPEELHKSLLDDYNSRLGARKWAFPMLGNREDEETRGVAPDVLTLEQDEDEKKEDGEAQGEDEKKDGAATKSSSFKRTRPPRFKRKRMIVHSKLQMFRKKKKAEEDARNKKFRSSKA